MFHPIWGWVTGRPVTTTKNLYSLTDEQVDSIYRMTKQPGWALYMQLIDRHTNTLGEQLLIGDHSELLETRGVIKGFREAPLIVANILQAKEQRDRNAQSERAAAESRTERAEQLSRFSPFFR